MYQYLYHHLYDQLSLLLLICVIKKVALAIAVMKAAADFTRDVWEAAFVPLGVYGFIIGFIVYWVYVTLYKLKYNDKFLDI